ncbi:MAG: Daunorubicin/doxorubicin resistance transporter ATP-binding protein DrrA, partial [Ilumatobacteraceae bacterium]|nr:Daunorubicin/doxorubicin resistance transporter ATP-binding protein DrrA [Ilumatobacteraceae bacterium]
PTFDEDLLTVSIALNDGTRLIDVVRTLDDAGVDAVDMNRREATLDDVFLTLTSPNRDADAPLDRQPESVLA